MTRLSLIQQVAPTGSQPIHCGAEALIPIYRYGQVADWTLVDARNVDDLTFLRWCRTFWGYAAASFKGQAVIMHRAILDLCYGDPLQGDHFNGDRLDNRESNLRAVTQAQNLQNLKSVGQTSRYRGVSFHAKLGQWRAQAKCNGRYFSGTFDSEIEAARAVSRWRSEHMPYTNEGRL